MRLPWRPVSLTGATVLTSLTDREICWLQRHAVGGRVLEVGSAFGYSAIRMAESGAHVTAVDPFVQYSLEALQANVRACGLEDKVLPVRARSQDHLPELMRRGMRFGLAFIDGDHSYEAVLTDMINAWELLLPGGWLACHDCGEDTCPEVEAAIRDSPFTGTIVADTLWAARR